MFKKLFLTLVFSFSTVVWSSNSFAADCSGASAAPGKYPGQYELSEYESAAGCTMSFSENPNIASINATIVGNGQNPNTKSIFITVLLANSLFICIHD